MKSAGYTILFACGLTVAAGADAQSGGEPATIEEITVIGRYPGPPLWRVSAGDRVLFIFGDLSPVPKGLDWDPRNLEVLAERVLPLVAAP